MNDVTMVKLTFPPKPFSSDSLLLPFYFNLFISFYLSFFLIVMMVN